MNAAPATLALVVGSTPVAPISCRRAHFGAFYTLQTLVRFPIEDDVSEECDRLCEEYERFEELLDAIEWVLARRCDKLKSLKRQVKGTLYHLYRFGSDPVAGTPEVTVVYTCDENEVNLIGIRAEEASPLEE
ncbi:MAG: hypothetical protein WEB63_10210 [Cucumibacter sp.]